jgi:pimeloyl-ACP methyl ester carboxylesterase
VICEDIKISLPYLTLAAKQWQGEHQGKYLLLHGWMDNAASFDALLPNLEFETALAIEFAGHGHSQHRPAGVSYQFSDYIADIALVIRQLQWQQFSIIGHSMGGSVAMMLSLIFPEKIKNLIMIESIGPLSGTPDEEPQRLIKSIKQQWDLQHYVPKSLSSVDLATKLRMRQSDLKKESATQLVQRGIILHKEGYHWRHDIRLLQYFPIYPTEEQVCAFMRQIACRTLVVEASRGLLVSNQKLKNRYDLIRGLTLISMEGGHHLHMEQPHQLAQPLKRFLRQLE